MPSIRGLENWLRQQNLVHKSNSNVLYGCTVGIDAWKYFLQYLPNDMMSNVVGTPDVVALTNLVQHHVDLFQDSHITPIFVFPGANPSNRVYELANPAPAPVPQPGKKVRLVAQSNLVTADDISFVFEDKGASARDKGWIKLQQNAAESAALAFAETPAGDSLTHRQIIIDALLAADAKVIIAPYGASAQLAWFDQSPQNMIHAAYGNTDLFLYNTTRVLINLNLSKRSIQYVNTKEIYTSTQLSSQQFLSACVLAGWGYNAETFPSSIEKNNFFKFNTVLSQIVAHSTLQGVVDAFKPKRHQEKIAAVKILNNSMDFLEGSLCLGPGASTVTVTSVKLARVTADATVAAPASASSIPQIPLPSSVMSLMSANAISVNVANIATVGRLLDMPVAVPSEELQQLIDWCNTHIRSQSMRVFTSSLVSSNAQYRQAYSGIINDDGSEDVKMNGIFTNYRWVDHVKGLWPRDMIPKAHTPIGRLFKEGKGDELSKSLLQHFVSVASQITVEGEIHYSQILKAIAAKNFSTRTLSVAENTQSIVVAAVLTVLFTLECIDDKAQLTTIGQAMVDALNMILTTDADSINAQEAVFVTLVMLRSELLNARSMILTPCDVNVDATIHVGRGEIDDKSQNTRLLARVLSVLPRSTDTSVPRVTVAALNQELCAYTCMGNVIIQALRFSYECCLVAIFSAGLFTAASGVEQIDSTASQAIIDLTQLSSIAPLALDVYADPTTAVTIYDMTHQRSQLLTNVPTDKHVSRASLYLAAVQELVIKLNQSNVAVSVSKANIDGAMSEFAQL